MTQDFSLKSLDVGSLPHMDIKIDVYNEGAVLLEKTPSLVYLLRRELPEQALYFIKKHNEHFINKIIADIEVPCYAQLRDMISQFLQKFKGIRRADRGKYEVLDKISLVDEGKIAEVEAIRLYAKNICERCGIRRIEFKVCITGPVELSLAIGTLHVMEDISRSLAVIAKNAIINTKYAKTVVVTFDEPSFLFSPPPLNLENEDTRDLIVKNLERVMHPAKSHGVFSAIHIHASPDIIWDVRSLDVIEAHTDAHIEKKDLEKYDKFLKAPIARTDIDNLLLEKLGDKEKVAKAWSNARKGKIDVDIWCEDEKLMKNRLLDYIRKFGEERVIFAGPECGLRAYPPIAAIELLKRVSRVVKEVKRRYGMK